MVDDPTKYLRRIYARKYREAHANDPLYKAKQREYERRYRERNREKIRERDRSEEVKLRRRERYHAKKHGT